MTGLPDSPATRRRRRMPEITLPYFLARPAGDGPWPGVVVVQEANGISTQLLRFCQRLAAGIRHPRARPVLPNGRLRGCQVHRARPQDEARGDTAGPRRVSRDASASSARRRSASPASAWGWHSPTRMAVQTETSRRRRRVLRQLHRGELGTPNCPTLLFFGGKDPWIPTENIEKVAAHHADTRRLPRRRARVHARPSPTTTTRRRSTEGGLASSPSSTPTCIAPATGRGTRAEPTPRRTVSSGVYTATCDGFSRSVRRRSGSREDADAAASSPCGGPTSNSTSAPSMRRRTVAASIDEWCTTGRHRRDAR